MATLDPTFNSDVDGAIYAISLQPDGRILIGGSFTAVNGSTRNRIARLNTDGTLDTGFNPSVDGNILAVALQPDGKILIGGSFATVNISTRNQIARLNADGTLDMGFGASMGGVVLAFAIQPDGKILVGGTFGTANGSPPGRIARFNADGTLDSGFVAPTLDYDVRAITLQPDGKILIGGFFTTADGQPRSRRARLNADGSLDTTFAASAIPNTNRIHDIALQADGKILLTGILTYYAAQRFNPDGTFAGNSAGVPSFIGSALALQPDGKILVGGSSNYPETRLVRLKSDLSRDTSFAPTFSGAVEALAIQPDGKILVGGEFTSINGVTRNRIARLLADAPTPSDEIHANNDSATTLTSTPVTVNILANDTKNGVPPVALADLQGLPTITLPPSNGAATVNPDGTVTYTPNPGFVGTDFFDYTILGKPAGG